MELNQNKVKSYESKNETKWKEKEYLNKKIKFFQLKIWR
jgi:hypothetical protein